MSKDAIFTWSELAFGDKKPVRSLKATFIMAPRTLSSARLKELIKTYLPKGNIVIGVSQEPNVLGFEDQPQFQMTDEASITPLVDKINAAKMPHSIHILRYSQRDVTHVIEKLKFQSVVLVNGSWKHSFHTLPAFYSLVKTQTPYEYVSPFTDEAEARAYEKQTQPIISKVLDLPGTDGHYDESEMVDLAQRAAKQSYDYAGQTGAALGQKDGKRYQLLGTGYNVVVPYQTFAMHFGASREQYFSPPNDLNHYDTVHAEVQIILTSLAAGRDLKGTTLFVTVLPCPVCSRVLVESGIREVVYQHDHSDGYAVRLLGKAGINVRRLVG